MDADDSAIKSSGVMKANLEVPRAIFVPLWEENPAVVAVFGGKSPPVECSSMGIVSGSVPHSPIVLVFGDSETKFGKHLSYLSCARSSRSFRSNGTRSN